MAKYDYENYLKAISKIPTNNQMAHTIGIIAIIMAVIVMLFMMSEFDYIWHR